MTSQLEHFLSSELSRNSAAVFAAAENSPVIVTRRDGENLVLMSESEAEARRQMFEFAAQIIAVTTDDRGSLAERMTDRFHWMLALSEQDRDECARELVAAARISFSTNQPHRAISTLISWRESASAIAAGLNNADIEWLDKPQLVKVPQ